MSHTFLTKIISKAFYDAVSFSIRIPTTYFELGLLIARFDSLTFFESDREQ